MIPELHSTYRRTSPPALLKTYVLLKAVTTSCSPVHVLSHVLCMVCESPAPLSRSNPSLSARSSRAAMSDMLALPADRLVTTADWHASVLRRSLAIDSCSDPQDHARGGCREGQGKQVPCVGLFALLGVLRSYVVARVLLLF